MSLSAHDVQVATTQSCISDLNSLISNIIASDNDAHIAVHGSHALYGAEMRRAYEEARRTEGVEGRIALAVCHSAEGRLHYAVGKASMILDERKGMRHISDAVASFAEAINMAHLPLHYHLGGIAFAQLGRPQSAAALQHKAIEAGMESGDMEVVVDAKKELTRIGSPQPLSEIVGSDGRVTFLRQKKPYLYTFWKFAFWLCATGLFAFFSPLLGVPVFLLLCGIAGYIAFGVGIAA